MRTASEIMGEFSNDEWTAHDWGVVHAAVKQAQTEALDEAAGIADKIDEHCRRMIERNGCDGNHTHRTVVGSTACDIAEQIRALADDKPKGGE